MTLANAITVRSSRSRPSSWCSRLRQLNSSLENWCLERLIVLVRSVMLIGDEGNWRLIMKRVNNRCEFYPRHKGVNIPKFYTHTAIECKEQYSRLINEYTIESKNSGKTLKKQIEKHDLQSQILDYLLKKRLNELSQTRVRSSSKYYDLHAAVDWTLAQRPSGLLALVCWVDFKMLRFEHYDVHERYSTATSTLSSSSDNTSIGENSETNSKQKPFILPGIKRLAEMVIDSLNHIEPEQHAICRIIIEILLWDSHRIEIHDSIEAISEAIIERIIDMCALRRLPTQELYKMELEKMLGCIVGRQFRDAKKRLDKFCQSAGVGHQIIAENSGMVSLCVIKNITKTKDDNNSRVLKTLSLMNVDTGLETMKNASRRLSLPTNFEFTKYRDSWINFSSSKTVVELNELRNVTESQTTTLLTPEQTFSTENKPHKKKVKLDQLEFLERKENILPYTPKSIESKPRTSMSKLNVPNQFLDFLVDNRQKPEETPSQKNSKSKVTKNKRTSRLSLPAKTIPIIRPIGRQNKNVKCLEDPYEFTDFQDEPFPEASLRASSRTLALVQSIKIAENKMKIQTNSRNPKKPDKMSKFNSVSKLQPSRPRFKIKQNIESLVSKNDPENNPKILKNTQNPLKTNHLHLSLTESSPNQRHEKSAEATTTVATSVTTANSMDAKDEAESIHEVSTSNLEKFNKREIFHRQITALEDKMDNLKTNSSNTKQKQRPKRMPLPAYEKFKSLIEESLPVQAKNKNESVKIKTNKMSESKLSVSSSSIPQAFHNKIELKMTLDNSKPTDESVSVEEQEAPNSTKNENKRFSMPISQDSRQNLDINNKKKPENRQNLLHELDQLELFRTAIFINSNQSEQPIIRRNLNFKVIRQQVAQGKIMFRNDLHRSVMDMLDKLVRELGKRNDELMQFVQRTRKDAQEYISNLESETK